MNRTIRQTFQWSLVCVLTVMLGASPVSAGWLRHHLKRRSSAVCCAPMPVCSVPVCPTAPVFPPAPIDCCPSSSAMFSPPVHVEPVYSAPVYSAPMVGSPVSGSSSGCQCDYGSVDVGSPVEMAMPMDSYVPMGETIIEDYATPMVESPIISDSYDSGTIHEEYPSAAQPIEMSTSDTTPIASPSDSATPAASVEPAATVEPQDEPAAEPTPDPAPAAKPEIPADDLFGAPADSPAAQAPADDLFGSPSEPAPAADAGGDLFGDPTPADAGGDLFGDPAPADSAPADAGMDDLFGDPSEGAAPADAGDDLFGNPPAEQKPATDSTIDDLFGSEPAEPAGEKSSDSVLEDLFGDSTTETTDEAKQATIEDLFGVTESFEELPAPIAQPAPVAKSAALQVVSNVSDSTDPIANAKVRTWIDNTGDFHVEGKLIEINESNIRLLKANGRTCTVPNSRLCDADAAYIASVQSKLAQSRVAMLTSNK
ncbi:hypothetical protein Poly51_29450 [Rubripirellula tenax]|uniref:SLA1 homology domain-containing protein n=1 Tax=Rubripirellula tenax TaxID=2528015 RepID=A0A5C6F9B3_9BACT|nr:SHD1 domain-containing protein [Rubripirellula tenax]TWU57024.1 hypothetical protein Poly51_29450 [Rubripirellula tenax]